MFLPANILQSGRIRDARSSPLARRSANIHLVAAIRVYKLISRKDTPLSELATLLSSEFPQAQKSGTRVAFRLLYTDTYRGRVLVKDVGTVTIGSNSTEDDSTKTLDDARYIIGDFIDVAILTGDQRLPSRPTFDGPRVGFNRFGGERPPRGRSDSYRGGGYSRGSRGGRLSGRNGFEDDERPSPSGPPSGPRRDRERW
jgi:histone deacetylase complex subunit SAP18